MCYSVICDGQNVVDPWLNRKQRCLNELFQRVFYYVLEHALFDVGVNRGNDEIRAHQIMFY